MGYQNKKYSLQWFVIALGIWIAVPCHAGVFKCTQGGQVIYSDKPCAGAKIVDTTNGKAPTASDAIRAQARSQLDQLSVLEKEARAQLDKERQAKCNQMVRDDNWVQSRAAKYKDDLWWQNKAADSTERLQRDCKGYLLQ